MRMNIDTNKGQVPDDAMPVEARRAKIGEIDAEIQRLRNERNDMAAQLQKAGIVR